LVSIQNAAFVVLVLILQNAENEAGMTVDPQTQRGKASEKRKKAKVSRTHV
jgi:hypothetical protein